jgi:hypothetical protein
MVSYYRDPLNPEAVHFPPQLYVLVIDGLILLEILVTVILGLIYGWGQHPLADLAVAVACLAVLALHFPKGITTDETGVHGGGFPANRKRMIRWKDIESVRERALVFGLPPFHTAFLANWVIEIRSVSGEGPIRMTCRHSGREAFLRELRRWGAPAPDLRRPLDRGPVTTAGGVNVR